MRSIAFTAFFVSFFALNLPARAAYLSEGVIDAATQGIVNGQPAGINRVFFLASGASPVPNTVSYNVGLKFGLGSTFGSGSVIEAAILTVNVTSTSYVSIAPIDTTTIQVSGFGTTTAPLTDGDFAAPMTVIGSVSLPTKLGSGGNFTHPLSFDVTSLARSLLAGGSAALGIEITDLVGATGTFFSGPTDTSPAGGQPVLEIIYAPAIVPEPASLTMMAFGVSLGLGWGACRRR